MWSAKPNRKGNSPGGEIALAGNSESMTRSVREKYGLSGKMESSLVS